MKKNCPLIIKIERGVWPQPIRNSKKEKGELSSNFKGS